MKILGIGNAIVDVICKVDDSFINGNNLTKSTMKLFFDENEFKQLLINLKIEITGDVHSLKVVACKSLNVTGNTGDIETTSGDISVQGDVDGNIDSTSGDIDTQGNISGSIKTLSGDVECGDITGNVQTMSGDVDAKTVHGGIKM